MEIAAALIVEPEAVANPSHTVEVDALKEAVVPVRFVMTPVVPVRFVEKRLVEVTLVAVALERVRFPRDVAPRTVKVEVTVEEAATNPPNKDNMLVVLAPLFVICWSVAVEAADPGQLVPLAKHTLNPFTRTDDARRVEPEAVANPSQTEEVAEVKLRVLIVPFVEKRLVLVTFVPVPFV
jgi:hypothetical protein